jgi:hypothetical protein
MNRLQGLFFSSRPRVHLGPTLPFALTPPAGENAFLPEPIVSSKNTFYMSRRLFGNCGTVGALALTLFVAMSCATPGSKLGQVSVGMTKAQVVKIMGPPTSTSVSDRVELLRYGLNAGRAMWTFDYTEYFVKLVNDRVESYGNAADLDRMKPLQ